MCSHSGSHSKSLEQSRLISTATGTRAMTDDHPGWELSPRLPAVSFKIRRI